MLRSTGTDRNSPPSSLSVMVRSDSEPGRSSASGISCSVSAGRETSPHCSSSPPPPHSSSSTTPPKFSHTRSPPRRGVRNQRVLQSAGSFAPTRNLVPGASVPHPLHPPRADLLSIRDQKLLHGSTVCEFLRNERRGGGVEPESRLVLNGQKDGERRDRWRPNGGGPSSRSIV